MPQFRKKPVVIEAHQWNPEERPTMIPTWLWERLSMDPDRFNQATGAVVISTLEGEMTAQPGDWIVKGIKGELYPVKPDIFEALYDPAD